MSERFEDYLARCQQRVEHALAIHLGEFESPFSAQPSAALLERLRAAMRYSTLNGGKRLRPLLVYAAAASIGQPSCHDDDLDRVACAVELLHGYSLIHDDLPAMDDDDLRRGRPTCHRAFDEATAILAGDALQTRAFALLGELQADAGTAVALLRLLAQAAGQVGMVGGQMIDLAAEAQPIDISQLETLHRLKTGALIRASVAMGATLAGASAAQLAALDRFADAIGLAFQVHDDVLDVESDTATLGKRQGADQARGKATYPALLGMTAAKEHARQLQRDAISALNELGEPAQRLRELADYIVARRH